MSLYKLVCLVKFFHDLWTTCIFIRRRSCSFAEYWKYFMARLNGVHAFGYNSAGGEPIWMKFGYSESIVYRCPWQILGAIGAEARARRIFCQVSNARFQWLPVGQISRKLHTRRGYVSRWIFLELNFENLPARGLFPKNAHFSMKSPSTSDFRLQTAITP